MKDFRLLEYLIILTKLSNIWSYWTILNNFEPIWTILDHAGPLINQFVSLLCWHQIYPDQWSGTSPISFALVQYNFDPIQSSMVHCGTVSAKTILDHFEPIWTMLDYHGTLWTTLTTMDFFEPFEQVYRAKTKLEYSVKLLLNGSDHFGPLCSTVDQFQQFF